jgi:N-methylhydantoinase B/oxoprolinase/acetone carboxylase alpha subunit
MKNEILEEVWRNRDAFAKRWNYDIDAMVAALQEMEQQSHRRLVDRRGKTSNKKPRTTSECAD